MSPPKSNLSDWDNFVHSTRSRTVPGHEIIERFKAFQALFQHLPKKELVMRGWLQTADDLASLASIFFDLPLSQNPTLFRKSATANEAMLLVWLSHARATAEYSCITESLPLFKSLGKSDLRQIAHLSPKPEVIKTLPAILAQFGIKLIYLPALPGMKADGAVFKLRSGHPVVALSLRFPRLDYFWFTLMHELAHVALHIDRLSKAIFVDVETEDDAVIEKAANKLAKESFVERSSWRNCEPKYQSGDKAVIKYAKQQGIHPSIVAGMLRRETGNYARYSTIINEHDVRQIIFPL